MRNIKIGDKRSKQQIEFSIACLNACQLNQEIVFQKKRIMMQQLPSDKGLFTFYKQQEKEEDELRKAHLVKNKSKTSIKSIIRKPGKIKDKNIGISFEQAFKEDITAKTERNQEMPQTISQKRKKTLDLTLQKNRKERAKNHSQVIIKAVEKLKNQSDRQSFKHLKDHLKNLIGEETPLNIQNKVQKQINEHIRLIKFNAQKRANQATDILNLVNKQRIVFTNQTQQGTERYVKLSKRKGNVRKIGIIKSNSMINKRFSQKLPTIQKSSRSKVSKKDLSFCKQIDHFKYISPQRLNKQPVLHQISLQKGCKKEYNLNFELISPSKHDKQNIPKQNMSFAQKGKHNVFSDAKFQQIISKIKFN